MGGIGFIALGKGGLTFFIIGTLTTTGVYNIFFSGSSTELLESLCWLFNGKTVADNVDVDYPLLLLNFYLLFGSYTGLCCSGYGWIIFYFNVINGVRGKLFFYLAIYEENNFLSDVLLRTVDGRPLDDDNLLFFFSFFNYKNTYYWVYKIYNASFLLF